MTAEMQHSTQLVNCLRMTFLGLEGSEVKDCLGSTHPMALTSTQCDRAETLYLVTVKPLPKRISIRRKIRKLTEKSSFPRENNG